MTIDEIIKADDGDAEENEDPEKEKGPDAEAEAEEKEDDDNQAEDAEDGDDAEAEDEEMSEKSEHLTESDLEKSLAQLETLIDGEDRTTRRNDLLSKAQTDDITDEEKQELFELLGKSDEDETPSLGEELRKGYAENDDIVQALDVSAYLRAQSDELTKSLDVLADHVEASDKRQHAFNMVLAKAVSDTGKLVKSVADQLGVIAEQPARAPKSAGVQGGQVLNKSFRGQSSGNGGALEDMSKGEVLDTLQSMLEKSVDGGHGAMAKCGEDLSIAIAKYDSTMAMSEPLLEEMQAFRAAQ